MEIPQITREEWQEDIAAFKEKTAAFFAGTFGKAQYKGFSGYYGSYAQRDGKACMLRLRMNCGRITKQKLAFAADAIRKYNVDLIHFSTCQNLQLHNLSGEAAGEIMEQALGAGILTIGGGGDYPRNVMCSPLSGVEKGEYFDVLPYAEATARFLTGFIRAKKLPRKLKVGFSNSPLNSTHATFRDLGFAARPDGKFDVYSAGGLGNKHRMGVLVAEAVDPVKTLYYVKAMWLTFSRYGNYKLRAQSRTRYMPAQLGSDEAYKAKFNEVLAEVLAGGEDLDINIKPEKIKKRDFKIISGFRVTPQKQVGLYAVNYHPAGGLPDIKNFLALADYLKDVKDAEIRLTPDEGAYIINLTAREAAKVIALTPDSAYNAFTTSVACIGSSVCQQGVGDSQALLRQCYEVLATEYAASDALPQIHISGCPSSCGTHQIGAIGFRGTVKVIKKVPHAAFTLFVNGCPIQGREKFAEEIGVLLAEDIPFFLVEVGKHVAVSGMDFNGWYNADPNAIREIAKGYMDKIELLGKDIK